MADKTLRIDSQSDDIIEEYANSENLSKKEIISRMVTFCYYNSIDFLRNNKTPTLNKLIQETEYRILKKISELPSSIKKIIDPDEYYFPIEDDLNFIQKCNNDYMKSKGLYDDFINFLGEKELKKYNDSLNNIDQFYKEQL